MPIKRAEHKKDFTMILNTVLNDEKLSYGARGLMAHVLTHYDNWFFTGEDYFITELDKKAKIRGYIKELLTSGYLKRTREVDPKGRLGNSIYIFYEIPNSSYPNLENHKMEEVKPNLEKPNLENLKQVKHIEDNRVNPNSEKPNLDYPNLGKPILENRKLNNTNINNINNNIYSLIFDYWISKNIKKHRSITNDMKKAIDKTLKEYSEEEIIQAINNYGVMYNDPNYKWCKYQWGLNEFLVRKDKDGIRQLGLFLNDGSKYINYLKSNEVSAENNNEKIIDKY